MFVAAGSCARPCVPAIPCRPTRCTQKSAAQPAFCAYGVSVRFQSSLRCLLPPCHTGCLLRSQSAPGVCSTGPAVTSCPNRRAKSSALMRTANNAAGGADETLKEEQTACIVQVGACTRGMACECAGACSAAPGPLTPLQPPTPAQPNLAMRRVPASEDPRKAPDTQGGNSTRSTCARNKAMANSVHSRAGAHGARPHQRWLAQPRSA